MHTYKRQIIFFIILTATMIYACTPQVPENVIDTTIHAACMPNNDGATLPRNVAPLNLRIEEEGDDYVTHIHGRYGAEIIISGRDVEMDIEAWHNLLDATAGDTLLTDIYVNRNGQWLHFPTLRNPIANDTIDAYITYRLIPPSYVAYENLTLHERCMENFDERVIYSNVPFSQGEDGQCMNCHVPQRQGLTGRSQFHVRQRLGGTVFIDGGNVRKLNLKTDSTLSAGVYPAWHPALNLIAYSVNETGQVFHTLDAQKVEVIDYASDLILYDLDSNELRSIGQTDADFESFPAWSNDGKRLYYISAHYEQQTNQIDAELEEHYDSLLYNIYYRPFNPTTKCFGSQQLLFDAAARGKSASQPRLSPDGKWMLFSLADYGQFHIWHRTSDLWIMDLHTGEAHALAEANSQESESYHSWSSNGHWILYSSRRIDGNYTRLYISRFDSTSGQASKPFLLPQKYPTNDANLLRSYNAAEWLVFPIRPDMSQLIHEVEKIPVQALYVGSALDR